MNTASESKRTSNIFFGECGGRVGLQTTRHVEHIRKKTDGSSSAFESQTIRCDQATNSCRRRQTRYALGCVRLRTLGADVRARGWRLARWQDDGHSAQMVRRTLGGCVCMGRWRGQALWSHGHFQVAFDLLPSIGARLQVDSGNDDGVGYRRGSSSVCQEA